MENKKYTNSVDIKKQAVELLTDHLIEADHEYENLLNRMALKRKEYIELEKNNKKPRIN